MNMHAILPAGAAFCFAAGVLAPAIGQAQNEQIDQSEPEIPSIEISVPIQISDLIAEANGVRVACVVQTAAEEVVGAGSFYIFDPDAELSDVDHQSKLLQAIDFEENGFDYAIGELHEASQTEPVVVQVSQTRGFRMDGWVKGRCELQIVTVFLQDPTVENSRYLVDSQPPRICGDAPENRWLRLCAFPQSELVSVVEFARPGFNADGTLQSLPGVD